MLNLSSTFWEKTVIEMLFAEESFAHLHKFLSKVKLYLSIKTTEVKQMNVSHKYIKENTKDC